MNRVRQRTDDLHSDVKKNEDRLRLLYAHSSDVVFRSFLIGGQIRALLVYIDGLTDSDGIDRYVMAPLMKEAEGIGFMELIDRRISVSQVQPVATFAQCIEHLSCGSAILLSDHETSGLALGLTKWEKRGVEEPQAEVGIRGPREGFTETLRINTSQLRRNCCRIIPTLRSRRC